MRITACNTCLRAAQLEFSVKSIKKYVHISQIDSYSSNVYVPKKQEGRMVGKTHTGSREGNKVNEKCRVKNGS